MSDFKLILKKELTDITRDMRSFVMLFVPVLLFPMMFLLMSTQMNDDLETNIPCIVEVEEGSSDEALYETLFEETGLVQRTEVDKGAAEDLKRGAVYAIIRVQDGQIDVVYNESSTKSTQVAQTLVTTLSVVSDETLKSNLLTEYDADIETLKPFQYSTIKLSDETGESGSSTMASIAPMLLAVSIMSSGVSVAIDVFTGEKERGTLESLMTTQVSRMSILMAKFVATLCISLMGMVLSILAYVISYMCSDSGKLMFGGSTETSSLGFTALQGVQLTVVCLTLSVFAVSLMTVIGLHAKSVKEAQSQMSIITIIPTLISGLTLFMETADIAPAAFWIPVFSSVVSIKMIFSNTAETYHIVFASVSCLLYSALMWFVSVKMLHSEKLLRG